MEVIVDVGGSCLLAQISAKTRVKRVDAVCGLFTSLKDYRSPNLFVFLLSSLTPTTPPSLTSTRPFILLFVPLRLHIITFFLQWLLKSHRQNRFARHLRH